MLEISMQLLDKNASQRTPLARVEKLLIRILELDKRGEIGQNTASAQAGRRDGRNIHSSESESYFDKTYGDSPDVQQDYVVVVAANPDAKTQHFTAKSGHNSAPKCEDVDYCFNVKVSA